VICKRFFIGFLLFLPSSQLVADPVNHLGEEQHPAQVDRIVLSVQPATHPDTVIAFLTRCYREVRENPAWLTGLPRQTLDDLQPQLITRDGRLKRSLRLYCVQPAERRGFPPVLITEQLNGR
jgi:hypothetical protein